MPQVVTVYEFYFTCVMPNCEMTTTLRTLKIDSLRSGDLKKLVGLIDLRYLDMHNSLSIRSKSNIPIWPLNRPVGIAELKQFIIDSPKNFHTIVILGHIDSRHYQEIVAAAKSLEMSTADGSPEKKMAIAAKEFIETLIANTDAMDFTHLTPAKYGGRIVGQVWLRVNKKWINLSDAIIENGLGLLALNLW